jgi:hypothetical protein
VGVVELTNEPTIATSSRPEFFNTTSLAYTLIKTHMAASTRKTILMIITVAPRGLEVDIVCVFEAVC